MSKDGTLCRFEKIAKSKIYISEYELYFSYVWDRHRADIQILMLPYLTSRNTGECSGAESYHPALRLLEFISM